MKKMLSVLLSIIFVCGIASTAVAETDIEKGKLAIMSVMKHVYDNTDYEERFPEDTFIVYETNAGKILVTAQTGTPRRVFAATMQTSLAMVTAMWKMFVNASAPYTDAEVLFYIGNGDDDIFFVTKDGILDVQAEVSYNLYEP